MSQLLTYTNKNGSSHTIITTQNVNNGEGDVVAQAKSKNEIGNNPYGDITVSNLFLKAGLKGLFKKK